MPSLDHVAEAVVRRAQRLGHVAPRDIRAELKLAELPEDRWKEVVALAKDSLNYRHGRYYAIANVSPRLHEQQEQQRRIERLVRKLIKAHKDAGKEQERRGQTRIDFVQPIRVQTEDGKSFTLLSRDISPSGIRLVGSKRLLGAKVHIFLPSGTEDETSELVVRILWTCAFGDDLFENGGMFLELVAGE